MFTPITTKALDDELEEIYNNINTINSLQTEDVIKTSLLENLMTQQRYMLEQKSKHLASMLQAGKNTAFDYIDADELHKEITSLKDQVETLYDKSKANSSRLDSIPEEDIKDNE